MVIDAIAKFLPSNRAALTPGTFSMLKLRTGGWAHAWVGGGQVCVFVAARRVGRWVAGRFESSPHPPDCALCLTGFSSVEIYRKYLWFVLRERKFNSEALDDLIALKGALRLSDAQARAALLCVRVCGVRGRAVVGARVVCRGGPRRSGQPDRARDASHACTLALPPMRMRLHTSQVGEALTERAQRVYEKYGTVMLNTEGLTQARMGGGGGGRGARGWRVQGGGHKPEHPSRLAPPLAPCPRTHAPRTHCPPHGPQAGLERKATARSLFSKLLFLLESPQLVAPEAAEARARPACMPACLPAACSRTHARHTLHAHTLAPSLCTRTYSEHSEHHALQGVDLGSIFGVTKADISAMRQKWTAEDTVDEEPGGEEE